MSYENKNKVVVESNNRIQALRKHVHARDEILVEGTSYTGNALIDVYQAAVDAQTAVDEKRKEWKTALAARKTAMAVRRSVERGVRGWVSTTYGPTSPEAQDFGFAPPKPRKVRPEKKVLAAAKSRATRKARHTMGKRQRADIKGVIEEPVLVSSNGSNGTSAPSNGASAPSNGVAVSRAPTGT